MRGSGRADLEIALSVPLVVEYEDVAKRMAPETGLSASDVDDVIDYLCSVAHLQVRELAKAEDVSINQLITTALAEKMSALMTVDYLAERAVRGDRSAFEQALAKVRDVEPDEDDA